MIGYGSESGAKDLTSTTRPLATIGSKTPQWVLFMVLPGASSQWRIATLSDVESLRGENRGTLRRNSDLLSVFFLRRKEDERTDLDTFARRCIGRTRRVVESGMGGEPRPAVLLRVVALEQHRLVRLQVREVIPAVIGIVGERIGLTNPVRGHQVTRHAVLRDDTLRIAQGQR